MPFSDYIGISTSFVHFSHGSVTTIVKLVSIGPMEISFIPMEELSFGKDISIERKDISIGYFLVRYVLT